MTDEIKTSAETIPTWGYDANGTGRIFHLEAGEELPDGWSDSPPGAPREIDESDVIRAELEPLDDELSDEELERLTDPDDGDQ